MDLIYFILNVSKVIQGKFRKNISDKLGCLLHKISSFDKYDYIRFFLIKCQKDH